jgi:hypothetical protein
VHTDPGRSSRHGRLRGAGSRGGGAANGAGQPVLQRARVGEVVPEGWGRGARSKQSLPCLGPTDGASWTWRSRPRLFGEHRWRQSRAEQRSDGASRTWRSRPRISATRPAPDCFVCRGQPQPRCQTSWNRRPAAHLRSRGRGDGSSSRGAANRGASGHHDMEAARRRQEQEQAGPRGGPAAAGEPGRWHSSSRRRKTSRPS